MNDYNIQTHHTTVFIDMAYFTAQSRIGKWQSKCIQTACIHTRIGRVHSIRPFNLLHTTPPPPLPLPLSNSLYRIFYFSHTLYLSACLLLFSNRIQPVGFMNENGIPWLLRAPEQRTAKPSTAVKLIKNAVSCSCSCICCFRLLLQFIFIAPGKSSVF